MYSTLPGKCQPLGATPDENGVNFSLFSQHATLVELLLFDSTTALAPSQVIQIPAPTLYYWSVYVKALGPGAVYAYRISGPNTPQDLITAGHRYNRNKVLLDPYARGNVEDLWVEADALDASDNVATAMRSVVIGEKDYDWQGDQPPNRSRRDTIIYELHVAGFTKSPTSGCVHPGTFVGLIEKIPYLQQLGITAVELMPVFDFDGKTVKRTNPITGEALHNYWGYDPYGFFAPQSAYCASPDRWTHVQEFRDMVKALHRAGIEVILDVVFNHTGEGNENGPVISFKGIDNSVYYYLKEDHRFYRGEYTGCGNAVNCNHPAVAKMIEECLHYWVCEMHVDGFRFDLGSLLAVGEDGQRLRYPPVVWAIDLDEAMAHIKVIAEPFGAGQDVLGSFPDVRWAIWNYRYRDTIRRFVRGDRGIVAEVATRIAGSSDLFSGDGQNPVNGVSYVACHDGFTLNDVVSYNTKHNDANAGDSGDTNNNSWNCGVEGPTADPAVEALRERQIRNFFAILLLSQGVPMILAGDECRRTQQGNNDPWLQDKQVSWFDWSLVERHKDLLRFVQRMIDFRTRHDAVRRQTFFTGSAAKRGLLDVAWHGCALDSPGWNDPNSGVLAFTIADPGNGEDLHVILNMEPQTLSFALPPVQERSWYRAVDTSLPSPADIMDRGTEPPIAGVSYTANGRSVVVLVSK